MKDRDVVLFLGAGFSCGADLPTMAGFGTASNKEFLAQRELKEKRESRDLYYNAGRVFELFRKYCSTANNYINVDNGNMEVLYSIAEALKETGLSEVTLDSETSLSPLELEKQIRLWLWKIYHRCPIVNRYNESLRRPYDSLMNIINKNIHKITVLTTNYDLVFEYISWLHGYPCNYPISEYERLPVTQNDERYLAEEDEDNSALIVKLHGSINFFNDANQTDRVYITDDIVKNGQRVGKSGVNSDRPAILPFDALWHLRDNQENILRKQDIVPAIVPPTYSKLRGYDWLRQMWERAYKAISDARLIVFIGYSFPNSDGFMRALFQGALAQRHKNLNLDVYVIDPNAGIHSEVGRNYLEFFSPLQNRLTLIPKSFSLSVENELPDILIRK